MVLVISGNYADNIITNAVPVLTVFIDCKRNGIFMGNIYATKVSAYPNRAVFISINIFNRIIAQAFSVFRVVFVKLES
jgi:hypothetical protein